MLQLCVCWDIEHLEVWTALKRLELLSAALRATLTPLSCSPNFPRAKYLDIRTLTHELIVSCRHLGTKRNKNQLHDYIYKRAGPINWDPHIVIPGPQLTLPEKTADMSRFYNWFPHERMSEEGAQNSTLLMTCYYFVFSKTSFRGETSGSVAKLP